MSANTIILVIVLSALLSTFVPGCAAHTDQTVQTRPSGGAASPAAAPAWVPPPAPTSSPARLAPHASTSPYAAELATARAAVEKFFGESFRAPYDVKIFPDRAALTDFARQRWGMEKTECWMVAMGVSSMMVVLSPEVWKTEACEHEPTPRHIHEIFTHELVHVFHGQHNPRHEFEGMDEAGWFVEGLAFHAADQITANRLARVRSAVAEGKSPAHLADAFSGQLRYDTSASIVRYIESRWGRAMLKRLLPATTNAEILTLLEITETDLLAAWRSWLQTPRT